MYSIARRAYFTLIEMLLVLGIIAVIGGVVALGVNNAVTQQRFYAEVSVITEKLRLAQDLMLILNSDVHAKFEKRDDSITFGIETESALYGGWEIEIKRGVKLRSIDAVTFGDEENNIDLKFFSGGTIMSKGVLALSSRGETQYICLPGYPQVITSTTDKERCQVPEERRDDDTIRRRTEFEIKTRLAKRKEPNDEKE